MENKSGNSKRAGTGKGGDFATRKNPFTAKRVAGSRPNLDEVASLGTALDAILDAECAIIIGQTRDGGALVLTILDGADRHRTYCSNESELEDAISEIIALYKTP